MVVWGIVNAKPYPTLFYRLLAHLTFPNGMRNELQFALMIPFSITLKLCTHQAIHVYQPSLHVWLRRSWDFASSI